MPAQPPDGNELALGSGPRYSEGAMKKWEYRVLVIDAPAGDVSEMPTELGTRGQDDLARRGEYNELAKILNRTGHDGWEVCGTTSGPEGILVILKRKQRPSPSGTTVLTPAEDDL